MRCDRCNLEENVFTILEKEKVCNYCKKGKFVCKQCGRSYRSMICGVNVFSSKLDGWRCWNCMIGKEAKEAINSNIWQVCKVVFEDVTDQELELKTYPAYEEKKTKCGDEALEIVKLFFKLTSQDPHLAYNDLVSESFKENCSKTQFISHVYRLGLKSYHSFKYNSIVVKFDQADIKGEVITKHGGIIPIRVLLGIELCVTNSWKITSVGYN